MPSLGVVRLLLLFLALAAPAASQEQYGAKGIFPVYETAGQWIIFDKKPEKRRPGPLAQGTRFLVVGSEGSDLFEVGRTSGTYGGACRGRKPLKLRSALLRGPRKAVGRPVIAIRVPASFSLKGSRAAYLALKNEVDENAYRRLGDAIRNSAVEDAKAGAFPLRLDDEKGLAFPEDPRPELIQSKIDFGSGLAVRGLREPFVFVEETQISASYRRCLRLADGGGLVGACAEMPRTLMAETALLQFVSYDPSGEGNPYLLAFTRVEPLWGDERWGFVVRKGGPRLFLMDATDIRCREGF